MVDISNLGNGERIKNIHTFLQGANPLALSEESVKAVLALEEACGDLASTEQMKRVRTANSPRLTVPTAKPMMANTAVSKGEQGKGFNANVLLIETFSSIRQLLHEGNINELSNRLQLLNMESKSLRDQGDKLLSTFKGNYDKLKVVNDTLLAQQKEDKALRAEFDSFSAQHDAIQEPIKQNLAQQKSIYGKLDEVDDLMTLVPSPPITEEDKDTATKLEETKAELTSRLSKLTTQNKQLLSKESGLNSQMTLLNQKITLLSDEIIKTADKAADLAQVANDSSKQLDKFIESAPRRVEIDGESWENTLALLTMLTAQLKKAMNEDSIRNMKEQEEVMMKVNEASRKDSEKKAKEAQEAADKAADSNKAASCASKIFSYVLLAVSVIATVASFGTAAPLTLAIAAIGIAMAVADIVLEETGHGSLMQMLANEISSAITNMLIGFGVPEEKAKQIGSIVGMIVAAVAFLAISLISMGSMIKNLVSTVKNVAQLLLKNVGTLLKTTIKALPKSLMTALGGMASKAAKVSDSVADGADSMVKLSKLAKLSDKFDDAQHTIKSISQAADKIDKSSDFVSIGGQMVKVSDSVADGASKMAKLTKFTKLADKFDDVKDASKAVKQVSDKADDITDVSSNIDNVTKKVKDHTVAMAKLEVAAKGINAGATVASAATTGGLNLHAASMGEKMKEMLAGMMLNNSTIEAITELLNQMIKAMSKNYEQFDEMFTSMLTGLLQSGQNKTNMMKTARYA